MNDFIRLEPADFAIDDLVAAARGESAALAPGVAVELLAAKDDPLATDALVQIIDTPEVDPRGRSAAIRVLADDPRIARSLRTLVADESPLVAEAARLAMGGPIDDG